MSSEDVMSQCPENIAKLAKDIMKQFDPKTARVNDPIYQKWYKEKFLPSLYPKQHLADQALDYLASIGFIKAGQLHNGTDWWLLTKDGYEYINK